MKEHLEAEIRRLIMTAYPYAVEFRIECGPQRPMLIAVTEDLSRMARDAKARQIAENGASA